MIDHHKEFVKKQDSHGESGSRSKDTNNSGSSSNSGKNDRSISDTKSYFDNSINEGDGDNKKINDHGKNDIRGTSAYTDLQIVQQSQPPTVSEKYNTGESAPPVGTSTSQLPVPLTACEQASVCTHQHLFINTSFRTL